MEKICVVHTENYDAFIYFGNGLHEMDLGNWKQARDYFTEALKLDPRFELAKYWLDACPSPTSPSIADMAEMSGSKLASHVETVIENAEQEAQLAKEAASAGGGGGGH